MQIAIEAVELEQLIVIYPGMLSYPMNEKIRVVSLSSLAEADCELWK
jgi:hypothetical protein